MSSFDETNNDVSVPVTPLTISRSLAAPFNTSPGLPRADLLPLHGDLKQYAKSYIHFVRRVQRLTSGVVSTSSPEATTTTKSVSRVVVVSKQLILLCDATSVVKRMIPIRAIRGIAVVPSVAVKLCVPDDYDLVLVFSATSNKNNKSKNDDDDLNNTMTLELFVEVIQMIHKEWSHDAIPVSEAATMKDLLFGAKIEKPPHERDPQERLQHLAKLVTQHSPRRPETQQHQHAVENVDSAKQMNEDIVDVREDHRIPTPHAENTLLLSSQRQREVAEALPKKPSPGPPSTVSTASLAPRVREQLFRILTKGEHADGLDGFTLDSATLATLTTDASTRRDVDAVVRDALKHLEAERAAIQNDLTAARCTLSRCDDTLEQLAECSRAIKTEHQCLQRTQQAANVRDVLAILVCTICDRSYRTLVSDYETNVVNHRLDALDNEIEWLTQRKCALEKQIILWNDRTKQVDCSDSNKHQAAGTNRNGESFIPMPSQSELKEAVRKSQYNMKAFQRL